MNYTTVKTFGDEGVVEPPVRNYTADARGAQARYLKLELNADADAALRLYEITSTRIQRLRKGSIGGGDHKYIG